MSASRKILFITLSNIGDVILTTRTLRRLLERPDRPQITVMVGPKAAELFQHDPAIHEVIVYDKHSTFAQKIALARRLRVKGFHEVVDLRNTLFPVAVLGLRGIPSLIHCKINRDGSYLFHIHIPERSHRQAEELLSAGSPGKPLVAIAPGAASELKRWPLDKFAEIARRITQNNLGQVLLVGGPENRELAETLTQQLPAVTIDLIGKTSLLQLAAVLKRSSLMISNDSGPMHMAVALGTPTIAIFGPSDYERYGPKGGGHAIVRKDLECSPCRKAQCPLGTHACMQDLAVQDVWRVVSKSLQEARKYGDMTRFGISNRDRVPSISHESS